MSSPEWPERHGAPSPLGARWTPDGTACNFALYSKHAERVRLLLYAADEPGVPLAEHELVLPAHKSSRVWHIRLTAGELDRAAYYAFRVDGPPPAGRFEDHAFDARKVLLDPYAREVYFPPGFSREAASGAGDNAGRAPLGVLPWPSDDAPEAGPPRPRRDRDLFIYELHVRGFTQSPSSGVAPPRRGTYLGVIDKIPHLVELGVTAVELMPVHQFDHDEKNYWGYMTLSFFAPHQRYATEPRACHARHEFREMVAALHAAGIEVILDVVYNHTTEGGETGPTYSLRGIDNSTYYIAGDGSGGRYADFSGTGNTLHCANRAVRRLVVDSLRHWVVDMGVDGFRFDLGSVFARNSDGTLNTDDPAIFGEIASDPALAGVRLIAEPWDAGGAYQLGRSFPGLMWMQWNGRFRDSVRRFIRGDHGLVGEVMARLYGSDDLFPDHRLDACRPWQSVNYIASHDGFTLYDQLAYTTRRNHANGHANTDGPAENYSSNCGHEGDDGAPPEVVRLRHQQARNFICLLMLANGTPMIRMGDEVLHTQAGNSNPFNQDNEISWMDWTKLEQNHGFFRFVKGMAAFRRSHPCLRTPVFWRERVRWHGVTADVDLAPHSRSLAVCVCDADATPEVYACINAWEGPLTFQIIDAAPGGWRIAVDTSRAPPEDIPEPPARQPLVGGQVTVGSRSVVVLERSL